MKRLFGIGFVLLSLAVAAQESIPAGTILPLQLNSSVRSNHVRTGQAISARVMQDVPLAGGPRLRAGAKALCRVVESKAASATSPAEVTLRFDQIVTRKRRIPITTNLRALGSMMDVADAQVPKTGPDRGTSEFDCTTEQIGGESVIHGGGPVTHGLDVVGHSAGNGVLVRVSAARAGKCHGEVGDARPQALWVFSSDACGIYDIPDLTLVHAGRSEPVGEIRLRSSKGEVNLRAGSGLLLRVVRSE